MIIVRKENRGRLDDWMHLEKGWYSRPLLASAYAALKFHQYLIYRTYFDKVWLFNKDMCTYRVYSSFGVRSYKFKFGSSSSSIYFPRLQSVYIYKVQ